MSERPIDRLDRIATALEAGAPIGAPDAAWLAAAVRDYRANAPEGRRLDDCLGLSTAPGRSPWWKQDAAERRDHALRQLAAMIAPGKTIVQQRDEIVRAVRAYERRRWLRDRALREVPAAYLGTREELLFVALREGNGKLPLGDLCHILSL